MKYYLAARYSRISELCEYRTWLRFNGHDVISRWLDGNHQIDDQGLSCEAKQLERTRFAQEDWADLMNCDCCISFTEPPRTTSSRGGRHVEFGGALAADKSCVVIGPRENVFHCLPHVAVFPDFATFCKYHGIRYEARCRKGGAA
jgi:hypothetical protein